MGSKTKIQWTEATWNPVTGCSKVSEGCRFCYAERVSHRFGYTKLPWIAANAKNNVVCHEDRLEFPVRWKRPRMIFVNSMSDLFHEQVPDDFITAVFGVMASCPSHIFQVLTKRESRMCELLNSEEFEANVFDHVWTPGFKNSEDRWPLKNVWLGVSVEDQKTADERIPILLNTPASIRWVSAEPLLGPIENMIGLHPDYETGLHWVVVGGESGSKDQQVRPMHPDWARSLRDQCVEANVPYFLKQWGEWEPIFAIHDYYDEDQRCEFKRGHFTGHERNGKSKAGRLIDGREWNEYPSLKGIQI